MNNLKLSLVQINLAWENKKENLSRIRQLINKEQPVSDIILLPEMFSTGFSMNPAPHAESMSGDTVQWMTELAENFNTLVCGSIIIKSDSEFVNRFIAVSANGVHAYYDKRHLFRMANEETFYKQGTQRVVFSWRGWRILPQICYDIRFPVWIRNQNDYDLALFVANWPEPRKDVWRSLLVARSIENQAYVAGVNRIGSDKNDINHSGDSMFINPKGNILADAGNEERVLTTTLSLDELEKFRIKFPAHIDKDSFTIT